MGPLVIPRFTKFEGDEQTYQINKIAAYAFANTSVRTLIVPENLREIGKYAFANTKFMTFLNLSLTDLEEIPEGCFLNSSIKSIALPDTIYRICAFAFNYSKLEFFKPMRNFAIIDPYGFCHCLNLSIANLSESSMEKLDPKAFFDCPNLKQLFISSRSKVINARTFYDTDIPEIKIPKTLTTLKEEAFANSGFLEFDFSESQVTVIPARTFIGCLRLERVVLGKKTTTIQKDAFAGSYVSEIIVFPALSKLEEGCFCNTSKLKELNLSVASVTVLPKAAFQNSFCGKLTLPAALEEISESAFANGSIAHITFGKTLKKIGAKAFFNCMKLYELDLSKTNLKEILDFTFSGCYSLSSVEFPVELKSIGKSAFSNSKIKSLQFPSSLEEIGENAFAECKQISRADLSLTKVKKVSDGLFANCSRLKTFSISKDVEGIGSSAFRGTKINEIKLAQTIKTLGSYAFAECRDLVTADFTLSHISSIADGLFMNCTKLKNFYTSSTKSIQMISSFSFLGTKLTEFTFGGQTIEAGAFAFCNELVSINFKSSYLSKLSEKVLFECTKLERIEFPLNLIEIGSLALYKTRIKTVSLPDSLSLLRPSCFEGCEFMENVNLEKAVIDTIPNNSFYGCMKLKRIVFPRGVKKVGAMAFAFSGLERVDITREIKEIGSFAFYGCSMLVNANLTLFRGKTLVRGMFCNCSLLYQVEFSKSIEVIGEECFTGTGVYRIKFPSHSNLSTIKSMAFMGCPDLKILDLRNTLIVSIDSFAFFECGRLRQIKLPSDILQDIGNYSFGRTGFREFNLPSSITSIGRRAFYECMDLINFTMSNIEFINISDGLFDGCSCLEAVALPQAVMMIGKMSFINTAVENLVVPYTASEIGYAAFAYCKELRRIDLSKTQVSVLPAECFAYCSKLKEVLLPDALTTVGNNCFACTGLRTITFPRFVSSLNESAFSKCPKLQKVFFAQSSLSRIPLFCFIGCQRLDEITLPVTLSEIGKAAFANTSIKEISLPFGVKVLGNISFANCYKLEKVDMSVCQVEVMPFGCFYNCTSLVECSLPPELVDFDITCFRYCSNLRVLEYCGFNMPTKGKIKLPKVELRVKMNYKGETFFGKKVVKGYYCGTAPEMTPKATDPLWVMPQQRSIGSPVSVGLIICLSLIIIFTYVFAGLKINEENDAQKYFLLEPLAR